MGFGRKFGSPIFLRGLKSFYGGLQLIVFLQIAIFGIKSQKGLEFVCFVGKKKNRSFIFFQNVLSQEW